MNGVLNSSRDEKRAWNTFFGTEQSWSLDYMTYTRSWMANLLQLGLSFVKLEILKLTKFNTKNTYCTKKLKNFFKKAKITMSFTYESNLIQ